MRHLSHAATALRIAAAGAAALALGCSGRDAVLGTVPRNDAGQFWSLTLDRRAVTMSTAAPYDTVRLTATPRDADGNPISGLPRPTFTSSDLQTAQVDSSGLVHALAPGQGVTVVATVSNGTYSLADTAMLNVTDTATAPIMAVLTIHPDSGDSAMAAVDLGKQLQARIVDAAGDSLQGLVVRYTSSDHRVATIDPWNGTITGIYPGRVTFTASATAYGTTKTDSVAYIIGFPSIVEVFARPEVSGGRTGYGFQPGHVTVGTGGAVIFVNTSPARIDVVFDDTTNVNGTPQLCFFLTFLNPDICGTGNIAPWALDSTKSLSALRIRGFPVAGTYPYHSALFGTAGNVSVVDWRTIQ